MGFMNMFRVYVDNKQSHTSHASVDVPLAHQMLPSSQVATCVCKDTVAICTITSIPFPLPCVCKEAIAAPLVLPVFDKLQDARESTTLKQIDSGLTSQLRRRKVFGT